MAEKKPFWVTGQNPITMMKPIDPRKKISSDKHHRNKKKQKQLNK